MKAPGAAPAGTWPAQLLGLLLVLAPAVVHPLHVAGGAGTAVRALSVLAGLFGAAVVAAGVYQRLRPPPPDAVDDVDAAHDAEPGRG